MSARWKRRLLGFAGWLPFGLVLAELFDVGDWEAWALIIAVSVGCGTNAVDPEDDE